MRLILLFSVQLLSTCLAGQSVNLTQQKDRWTIQNDGSIEWKIDDRLPHKDHIEMSGEKVSLWMQYGVDTSGASNYTERSYFLPIACFLPAR